MKKLSLLFVALFLMLNANFANAQTADEIITKYITNIGGAEKLNKLSGVKTELTLSQAGMEIPIEFVEMKGGKKYIKISIQGKEIMQNVSDGNTVWNTNFMTMKPEKADSEATENDKLNNQDFPSEFLDYKEKGYKAEYVGKETKDGTECFKIKFTKKPVKVDGVATDNISYYYFDTEAYLPIVSESEMKSGPMKGQKSTVKFSDYQEVEGLFFPFSIEQSGQPLKVKKVTLNPTVEEKVFAFPAQ